MRGLAPATRCIREQDCRTGRREPEKPVGSLCAVKIGGVTQVEARFKGDRNLIRERAACWVLGKLWTYLKVKSFAIASKKWYNTICINNRRMFKWKKTITLTNNYFKNRTRTKRKANQIKAVLKLIEEGGPFPLSPVTGKKLPAASTRSRFGRFIRNGNTVKSSRRVKEDIMRLIAEKGN